MNGDSRRATHSAPKDPVPRLRPALLRRVSGVTLGNRPRRPVTKGHVHSPGGIAGIHHGTRPCPARSSLVDFSEGYIAVQAVCTQSTHEEVPHPAALTRGVSFVPRHRLSRHDVLQRPAPTASWTVCPGSTCSRHPCWV